MKDEKNIEANIISYVSWIIDDSFLKELTTLKRIELYGAKYNIWRKKLCFRMRVHFYVVQLAAVITLETPMYEPEPAINFVIVCVPYLMNIVKLIPPP